MVSKIIFLRQKKKYCLCSILPRKRQCGHQHPLLYDYIKHFLTWNDHKVIVLFFMANAETPWGIFKIMIFGGHISFFANKIDFFFFCFSWNIVFRFRMSDFHVRSYFYYFWIHRIWYTIGSYFFWWNHNFFFNFLPGQIPSEIMIVMTLKKIAKELGTTTTNQGKI